MVMKVKSTYCGKHFTVYINIKSLPETNIMLFVNNTSIKNKKRKQLAFRHLKKKKKNLLGNKILSIKILVREEKGKEKMNVQG